MKYEFRIEDAGENHVTGECTVRDSLGNRRSGIQVKEHSRAEVMQELLRFWAIVKDGQDMLSTNIDKEA